MAITIFRPRDLYNTPGQRGLFGVGRSHFYDEIEPRLEKVKLGPRAVGYTSSSVDKLIREGVKEAHAERAAADAAGAR